ncbi:cytochrome c, mono- and diheme variants family [Xenococcus sp. PCC 7305]|uniref:c-type cytochrome n=1 Tax=Xenococcus sp. PCC 7305 TaxID=102125 RepID=UPI0002ACC3C1|nr:cytochrome c [Xenococcus sp. PCC 7305]ELS03395.1 cytochrome c, mono- and diheme variants family [Xenococcus sp. PCC 7305]
MLIFVVLVAGTYFYQGTSPYCQEVLALEGNIGKGRDIFQINCAVCHGATAEGNIGPSLRNIAKRKSKTALINQVVSGDTPPMPKFKPNSQEMADLLSYLEQID